MSKDIKDYLHFYFKGWGTITNSKHEIYSGGEWALSARILEEAMMNELVFTPHLRPLSDMTEEEAAILDEMARTQGDGAIHIGGKAKFFAGIRTKSAEAFRWLLSKHFDLFGLIDAGLAIDKTKTP